MSSKLELQTPAIRQVSWTAYLCRAALVVVWLPVLYMLSFEIPQFEAMYSQLRNRGELPYITEFMLTFSGGGRVLTIVACLLFLVLLIVADLGVAHWSSGSGRASPYRMWFTGMLLLGISASAFMTIALAMPIIKMSQSI